MHSKNYYKYRTYYRNKLWDINRLWNVVGIGTLGITEEEYQEITGFVYPAKA